MPSWAVLTRAVPPEWNQLFPPSFPDKQPGKTFLRGSSSVPRLLRLLPGRIQATATSMLWHPKSTVLTWKACRSQGQIFLGGMNLKFKAYCGPTPLVRTSSFGSPIKIQGCRQHHQSYGWILMPSLPAYVLFCQAEHLHHSEFSVTARISLWMGAIISLLQGGSGSLPTWSETEPPPLAKEQV